MSKSRAFTRSAWQSPSGLRLSASDKRKLPASISEFAVCGNRAFAVWFGLPVLDRASGRVLFQGNEESDYLTSGFAVHDDRVFVLGNRAAYAYRCS